MTPAVLVFHVVAGSLGLISGYVALYASKGAPIHRRAGLVFVAVMTAMAFTGAILAVQHRTWMEVNVPAGLTTAYLVVTGWTTVRPPATATRRLEVGAMLVAFVVGLTCLVFGAQAIAGGGSRGGIPAFPFLLFGLAGTLGAVGDLRRLRAAAPTRGTTRIVRHLWRMTLALAIAAMSFFLGQADVFPKPMRILPLLATPVVAVLATLLYWVWRVRIRRSLRGLLELSARSAA